MSRLASFRGPSAPASPKSRSTTSNTSSPKADPSISSYHRKFKTLLQDLRSTAENWDDLVLSDGHRGMKALIDARTSLSNTLSVSPLPRSRVVGPSIAIMEKSLGNLDSVLMKLKGRLRKMNQIIENIDLLFFDAIKTKGYEWVSEKPLWTTWPMERFVTQLPDILVPYHRSLNMHIDLVDSIRSHSTAFEISKAALNEWTAQPYLEDDGWSAKWEDLCSVEVDGWD